MPEVKLDRLFVPVDFSTLSDRAVDYARRIAGRHSAEILLAHVSQPVSPMAVPEAAWYHLELASNSGIIEAILTVAKINLGLPHDLLEDFEIEVCTHLKISKSV